jgi:hypothetical protein
MTPEEHAAKYPLHTKLESLEKEQRVAQEFLEFLEERGYLIAERDSNASRMRQYAGQDLLPITKRPAEIIGEFLGIDAKEFSDEKDRMYQELVSTEQSP